jgi:hypothetical protein
MRGFARTNRFIFFLLLTLVTTQWRSPLTSLAQDIRHPEQPSIPPAEQLSSPLWAERLSANLDQDQKPDLAQFTTTGGLKSIRIAFGNAQTSHLYFKNPTGDLGHLFADDIDRDRDADLVWVPQYQIERAVVWLGNGRGQFKLVESPKPFQAELSRLYGRERDDTSNLTVDDETQALATGQRHDVAIKDEGLPRFLPTSIKLHTCGMACRTLENRFYTYRKRGPPSPAPLAS